MSKRSQPAPFPIDFPLGSEIFQVSPHVTNKEKQEIASCILSTLTGLAEVISHQDEGFDGRDVAWGIEYIAAFAKGLLDSMEIEGATT